MNQEFKTTKGKGFFIEQPTISKLVNGNTQPFSNVSKAVGNLVLVQVLTVSTITSSGWEFVPAPGDTIRIAGFTNAGNNGKFTVSNVSQNTVTYTNVSGVTETISSARELVKVEYAALKVYQDVSFSSGVPCYAQVSANAALTLVPTGGAYAYVSIINTTNADAIIQISGGQILCPAGFTVSHDVKQFTSNVTGIATGATTGKLTVNIS